MPTATLTRLQSFRFFDLVDAHPEVTPELAEHASDVLEGFNRTARQMDVTLGEMHARSLDGMQRFLGDHNKVDVAHPSAVGLAMVIAADGLAAAVGGIEAFGPTGARR